MYWIIIVLAFILLLTALGFMAQTLWAEFRGNDKVGNSGEETE